MHVLNAIVLIGIKKGKKEMGKKVDLTGMRFGRLTVLNDEGMAKNKHYQWKCRCDCGNITIVGMSNLKSGTTSSCGCLQSEKTRERNRKLCTTHGLSNTLIYSIWRAMIARCTNPNNNSYHDYGKRGIKVCDRWLDVRNFFADMGERPDDLTLERIDNNLGYSKENCCWASHTTQSRNQRVQKNNKTGVRGIRWSKQCHKYTVTISAKGEKIHLGLFNTMAEAAEARRLGEIKYWGKEAI